MCGKMVNEPLIPISHYGEKLLVCRECYGQEKKKSTQRQAEQTPKTKVTKPSNQIWEPQYEVVDNYAQLVREAREKIGLPIPELALKLGIKESVLRRIESGKLQPDVETARKLERFLRIQLLIKRENTQSAKGATQNYSGLELRYAARLKDTD